MQTEEADLGRRCAIPLPVASHKQLKGEKGDEEAEPVSPDNNVAFFPVIFIITFDKKNKKHSRVVL